jgi:hypothetical protein
MPSTQPSRQQSTQQPSVTPLTPTPTIAPTAVYVYKLAGSGISSSSTDDVGDGAPAFYAGLDVPTGLWANSNSSVVYISEADGCRVRWVDMSSGIMHTILGTGDCATFSSSSGASLSAAAATAVSVSHPVGLWGDEASQLLYVAEQGGHCVLVVDIATNEVAIFAGTGAPGYAGDEGEAALAQLRGPTYLHSPPSSSSAASAGELQLLVADTGNNVIRQVDAAGIIRTVVGRNGGAGSSGDGGAATAVQLSAPTGIFVDPIDGLTMYVADTGNHKIRKVSATGIINTLSGSGRAGYDNGYGVALDAVLNMPSAVWVLQEGEH